MSKLVDRAVNALIRPPRKKYDQSAIPLFLKGDDSDVYIRLPLDFINKRNVQIVGSYYYGSNMDPHGGGPCVLYLHGNASSQLEGQFLVPNLCKYGIFVYCFDFAGCGCSGGKYVSLGYYEKEDTEFIIDQLHTQLNLGPFILWGRSMGAATSLLVDHPLIIGRISDSAFTSIPDMCSAIAISYHLPSIFIPLFLFILKQRVIHEAKFNIEDVSPISVKYKKIIPAIFGHAKNDQFIPFDQCERLFKHYSGDSKKLQILNGGHNSRRERSWIQLCVTFIFNGFGLKIENPKFSTKRSLQESTFHFSSFNEMLVEQDKENNKNIKKRHRRKKRNSFDSYNSHYDYNSKNRHWKHHKHYKFSKKDFLSKNSRFQKYKFDYRMMKLNSQNENPQNDIEMQKTSDKNNQNLNNNNDMQETNNKIDQKNNQQNENKMQQNDQKEKLHNDHKTQKENQQNENKIQQTDQKEKLHNDHKIQKENQQNENKIQQNDQKEKLYNEHKTQKENQQNENIKINQKDDKKLEKEDNNNEKDDHQNSHNNSIDSNQVENQSKDDHHTKHRNSHQKHAQNKGKVHHKHNEHHHIESSEDNEKEIQQKKKNQTDEKEIDHHEMLKVEKKDNKSNDHIGNGHHHKHSQHPHASIENKNECDRKDHHGKLKANENSNK